MNILDNIYHYIFQFIVIALFTVPTMLFIGWLIDKKVTKCSKKIEEKDRKEQRTKIIKGFIHAISELKEEKQNIEIDDAWIKEEDDKEICFFYKNHMVYTNLKHDVCPRFYTCRNDFWINSNDIKYTILRTFQEIDNEIEVEKRALDYVTKRIEEMGWKSKECQLHPKFRGHLKEFVKGSNTVLYLSQEESRMKVSIHNNETGPCWGFKEVVLTDKPIGHPKDSFLNHVDELVEAVTKWEKFI